MMGTERTLETITCWPTVMAAGARVLLLRGEGESTLGALGACTEGPRHVGASGACTGSPRARPRALEGDVWLPIISTHVSAAV